MTDLSTLKLADRESYLRSQGFFKDCPDPQYSIVWEDPNDLDGNCAVTVPSPQWLKMALLGGVLPPVDVYHKLEHDEQGRVLNGHILHETPPIGPLTEEEAMEYLLQKDVPLHVWAETRGNSRKFVICKRAMVPTDRSFRNAWQLDQEAA